MKWIGVTILAVIGIIAAFVAIEYFVVSIHSLPSYIPGHKNVNGHYHKRGALAAIVAVVAFAGAFILARPRPEAKPVAAPAPAADPTPSSVDDLLSAPAPAPARDEGDTPAG